MVSDVFVVSLLLVLIFPGCAVVNPNVTLERPTSTSKIYTTAQGLEYAEKAITAYDYHIASNNWFSGTTGVLMIGVSAAALALGITDGGTTAITALGVSGASLFGMGTFLSDHSRNMIYNEGKEKVICAIAVVQPLFLLPEQIKDFESALKAINTEIKHVRLGVQNVSVEMELVPNVSLKEKARQQIAFSLDTIEAGKTAFDAGTKLHLQLTRAGNALVTAVDGINVMVNQRLAGTVSNLEAANTIIGGLAAATTRLTTVPQKAQEQAEAAQDRANESFIADEQPESADEDELRHALIKLQQSNGKLGGAVAHVAAIAANVGTPLENLDQCKLETKELILSVNPASVEFTKGTAGTRRVIIVSGKKPFAAQLLEQSDAKHISIEQPVPFGSTVDVKYDGDSGVKSTHTIHIVDGGDRHAFVNVEVKAP